MIHLITAPERLLPQSKKVMIADEIERIEDTIIKKLKEITGLVKDRDLLLSDLSLEITSKQAKGYIRKTAEHYARLYTEANDLIYDFDYFALYNYIERIWKLERDVIYEKVLEYKRRIKDSQEKLNAPDYWDLPF